MYKLKTKPWEHQIKALDYLMIRDRAALYTDMGTGKTKVGLDLISNRGFQSTLIVTTKLSCAVWEDEINIHLNSRNFVVCNLSKASSKKKEQLVKSAYETQVKTGLPLIMVINYDSVWREPFKSQLMKQLPECIICDESHRIKSPGSKCSLFLKTLGKYVPYKYIFTGTPAPERPTDVYAQYRFLDPTIFGTSFAKFRDVYENVDAVKSQYAGYRALDRENPYKNIDLLREKMYSCAFYVHSSVQLPETVDFTVHFTPSKKAIKVYKDLKKEGVLYGKDGFSDISNALTRVLRLQQILSGYAVYDNADFTGTVTELLDTARIDRLEELLEGIPPYEKTVVFVKFRHDFDEIENLCGKLNITYGEISGKRNDYAEWKEGKIRLIAVHYRSGSESISLTEARYCIYYSLSHSYGMYLQSRKRVHRPKQTRPVVYYHIVAKIPKTKTKTIDEQIMMALGEKKNVVDYLMEKKKE